MVDGGAEGLSEGKELERSGNGRRNGRNRGPTVDRFMVLIITPRKVVGEKEGNTLGGEY